MVKVSVIIPVKNGAATIRRCIDALLNQTISHSIEIIVIDSGSQDESLQILSELPVKVISIDPDSFDHGETRNLGIHYAAGDILYYTVQDACIAEENGLAKMLAHFDDEKIQAVCGIQAVPAELDKNPVAWHSPVSQTGILSMYFTSANSFLQLSPQKKVELCGWDNVNAMYRKSALQILPFAKCDFGEDMVWCKEALCKGFTLIKDTAAITWHYHFNSYRYRYKTNLMVGFMQYREFDFLPDYISIPAYFTFVTKKLVKHSSVSLLSKFYWFFHNIMILSADIMATRHLRRAASKGGLKAVKELYDSKYEKGVIGRLKHQKI